MKARLLPALVFGYVAFGSQAAPAVILDIVPSSLQGPPGTTAAAEIRISGLGDLTTPSLGTFDLDVNFDANILSFSSVTYGDPVLGDQLDVLGLGSITQTTPGAGAVNLFELSLDSAPDLDRLQAGAFTLATVSFDVVATGLGPLSLGVNFLGDAAGAPLPVPATVLLLGSGLAGIGGATWFKRLRRR